MVEHPILNRLSDRIIVVDGCWEWIGTFSNNGHLPTARYNYKTTPVRRIIADALGADIKDKRILTTCGSHRCVNPAHFRIFPTTEAVRLVASYGAELNATRPYKPNQGNVKRRKLIDEQVRYIRESSLSGYALAKELGVSHATINAIRRGEKYKEVGVVNMWSQLLRKAA